MRKIRYNNKMPRHKIQIIIYYGLLLLYFIISVSDESFTLSVNNLAECLMISFGAVWISGLFIDKLLEGVL